MGVTTPVVGNSTGRSINCVMVKFDDPLKSQSVIGGVGQIGNECYKAKAQSMKQWVEPESTRV